MFNDNKNVQIGSGPRISWPRVSGSERKNIYESQVHNTVHEYEDLAWELYLAVTI
jgi:hypothetical protein